MDQNELKRYWVRFCDVLDTLRTYRNNFIQELEDTIVEFVMPADLTLGDTFNEKIGGGPHGYGDPADTSIRREEEYLLPPMIWRKIRHEKCLKVTENFYRCMQDYDDRAVNKCESQKKAMFECRSLYYQPGKIDEIENECIQDYVKLRSKFRESGSEEDLWNMKRLILDPRYENLYKDET